ncbi:hypothetical protein [Candidatus Palauibacter sp.]|uniref:hypothetical protein n=1 Tax=Candidatus Palauibacter sp. TaxID=3101350 RepID=UPI003B52BB0E
MRAVRRVGGIILSIPLALACAAPASGPPPGEVPEWTLRRGLVIGSPDDPVYGLWRVGGVLADDALVYVLMPGEGAIRVFTRDGEFVRDLGGGRGAGPGEMMSPGLMAWGGSMTISVSDMESRRFTFYEVTTGEALTIPHHAYLSDARGTGALQPAVALPDFRAANFPLPSDAYRGRGPLMTSPMMVLDTAGMVRDTLALLSVPVAVDIVAGVVEGGRFDMLHPLEQYDTWQFAPDGSRVAIVDRRSWTGTGSAEFGVMAVGLEGDTLFHRRIAYGPRPVPDGYYAREVEQLLDFPVVADRGAFAAAVREFLETIRYLPPVTHVTVGNDGTTWLAGVDEGGEREWLVLGPSGSSIGRFRLPTTSRVSYANGNEAWVVERDALDIPYVVHYEIVR